MKEILQINELNFKLPVLSICS